MAQRQGVTATCTVRAMGPHDQAALSAHFARHKAESGRDGIHFMPYLADSDQGPRGADLAALEQPLDEPGWQRWFVAQAPDGRIVGHLDLRGDRLRTARHRCTLGIGIEASHRGAGVGRRLMQQALDFARQQAGLAWVELWVFGNNRPAIALYQRMGFQTIGTTPDQFRFGQVCVDDIHMVLKL